MNTLKERTLSRIEDWQTPPPIAELLKDWLSEIDRLEKKISFLFGQTYSAELAELREAKALARLQNQQIFPDEDFLKLFPEIDQLENKESLPKITTPQLNDEVYRNEH